MKVGQKLVHRVTGVEYKFVKQLGPHCVVENSDGRKSFAPSILRVMEQRDYTLGHPGRKGYTIGDQVWIRIQGHHYELLAQVIGRDSKNGILVEVIDEQTTIDVPYKGFQVWQVWRSKDEHKGIELESKHYKIVRRA